MRLYVAIAAIGLTLSGTVPAGQPAGGDFVLVKSTVDGGGGSSTGGNFELTGTIGQPDASAQASTGVDLAVAGGFWALITEFVAELIFSDGFE